MTLTESGPPVEHAVPLAPGSPVVAQLEPLASVPEPAVADAPEARFTIAVWQLATILTGIIIVVGVLLLGIHPPKIDVAGLPSSIKLLVPALFIALVGLVLAKKRESQRRSSSES
jgi:hypothetical protein